jgi:hypothetical protein
MAHRSTLSPHLPSLPSFSLSPTLLGDIGPGVGVFPGLIHKSLCSEVRSVDGHPLVGQVDIRGPFVWELLRVEGIAQEWKLLCLDHGGILDPLAVLSEGSDVVKGTQLGVALERLRLQS